MSEGTLTRAGRMKVDGEFLTGVFVEMSGHEIMRLSRKGIYNKKVKPICPLGLLLRRYMMPTSGKFEGMKTRSKYDGSHSCSESRTAAHCL
jgi:hypothetical protein